jgi:hypothetical protein
MSAKFVREAAAALLQFAKSTSDPKVAAALIEKAADIKERIGDMPAPPDLLSSTVNKPPK